MVGKAEWSAQAYPEPGDLWLTTGWLKGGELQARRHSDWGMEGKIGRLSVILGVGGSKKESEH